ncbi:hypothetical protein [Persephonella sp.]|uniref:hypothetical protein n=1 Tax=Persephonella sp. TaxID=2060922 RepID=UPI0025E1F651|nr:hypothetical protein [Persephonella sp.]
MENISFNSIPPQMNLYDYREFERFLTIANRLLVEYMEEEINSEIFQEQLCKLFDLLFELSNGSYTKTINLISDFIEDEDIYRKLKVATSFYNATTSKFLHSTINVFPVMPLKIVVSGGNI